MASLIHKFKDSPPLRINLKKIMNELNLMKKKCKTRSRRFAMKRKLKIFSVKMAIYRKKLLWLKNFSKKGSIQKRLVPYTFREGLRGHSEDKLVFYPTGVTSAIFRTILEEEAMSGCYLTRQKLLSRIIHVFNENEPKLSSVVY